jgi:hypothetical protein
VYEDDTVLASVIVVAIVKVQPLSSSPDPEKATSWSEPIDLPEV